MNIALVSREFPPFYGGGIGTYTEQAAHALASAGHRVVVLTVSDDGSESRVPHTRDPGVTVFRVPLVLGTDWSRPAPAIDTPQNRAALEQLGPWCLFSRQVADALPAIVREFSIDVVEAPECGGILWWTLNRRRLGSRSLSTPDGRSPLLVVQLHSPNEWIDEYNREAPPRRSSLELRRAERESAQWADLVISPSRDLGAWAMKRWGISPVKTVPYPLGHLIASTESPTRRVLATGAAAGRGPLRCLLVGRMEPRKGIDIALRALVIASRRGADLHMEFAGQDTRDWRTGAWFARRSLHAIVPPAFASRVTLLGKLDAPALAQARARADLCLAPGVVDNFPYAAVESMAAGLPVVAPSVGGMSELVRDGVEGHIFIPSDPTLLAEALMAHDALSAEARATMSRAARARVAEFCANQRAVGIRVELFQRTITERSARARAPMPRVVAAIVGDDTPALRHAIEACGADFAIGWEHTSNTDHRVFGTPGVVSTAIAAPVRGPVAVRADLLESFKREQGSGPVDAQLFVEWLIAHHAQASVDPDTKTRVEPDERPATPVSPLWLHPQTFAHASPLQIARRVHPFPWDVVLCDPSVTHHPRPGPESPGAASE